jgi:hypothetical protein
MASQPTRLRVFENRVLRRILGPKMEDKESYALKSSVICIIWMMKLRRMRWAGHIKCMREMINAHKILFLRRTLLHGVSK